MNVIEAILLGYVVISSLQLCLGLLKYIASEYISERKQGARHIITTPIAPIILILAIARGAARIWRTADFKGRASK